jgi:catechol 2,3-dioxygenase-like lactoylglutathione lyase family enzyme
MPGLDTYRKQAKQFVRWHRDREWTVAQVIREWAPRFAAMSDREILDAPFKLADAQEIVARKAGFESWAELKASAAVEPETRSAKDAEPRIRTAVAHVFVTDLARAAAFYRDALGFTIEFTYGEPAYFGAVVRDGARFYLRHVDHPLIDDALRRREHLLTLALIVENREQLKRLYASVEAAGVPMHQPMKMHPWGDWDFVVRDPDGNLLSFVCGPEPR